MIRTLNIVLAITSVLGMILVYGLKYQVAATAGQKAELERVIERQEADLSVLKADWAYLNQPTHIGPIVQRHQAVLGLEVMRPQQVATFADLPMRPAETNDTGALDALFEALNSGVDPIAALIEEELQN